MCPGCCIFIIKTKYNFSSDNFLMKPFPVLQELSRSSAFCQSPLSCPDTKTGREKKESHNITNKESYQNNGP